MISKKINLAIWVVLVLVTACAPMTTSFYRPEALGGIVVTGACPPVESIILFEIKGITVSVKASDSKRDKIGVFIGFEIPEGKTVILEKDQVASILEDQIFDSHVLAGHMWISRGHIGEIEPGIPMVGKHEDRFLWPSGPGKTDSAYYWFSSALSVPESESFILKMPNILVNSIEVQLPPIQFTKDQETYIGSLNC